MYIILEGQVAVYKSREDTDIFLETDFLQRAKKIIVAKNLNSDELIPFEKITNYLDQEFLEKISIMEGVKGSNILLN